MDIALKIKELIEEKKISITDFADKLAVSRNTVYNFLSKKHPIDVELLQKIALILDIPIVTFFELSDQKSYQELLKTTESQNETIRSLNQKLILIDSIVSTMKTYYWMRFNTVDSSIKNAIVSDSQYKEIDSMFMAALNAILYFDNDPETLLEYQQSIIGLRDRVRQPSIRSLRENGMNTETTK